MQLVSCESEIDLISYCNYLSSIKVPMRNQTCMYDLSLFADCKQVKCILQSFSACRYMFGRVSCNEMNAFELLSLINLLEHRHPHSRLESN